MTDKDHLEAEKYMENVMDGLNNMSLVSELSETNGAINSKNDSETNFRTNVHHHFRTEPNSRSQKRTEDVLEWHEYFMASACLIAKRSKDPVTRVGAVIVNEDKKIVGTGYNGMPRGCSDDVFPWGKNTTGESDLNCKYLYVCHAEMNAILNKNSADTKNCIIYTSLFPCNECAKIIIQSGIKEVIYISDKNMHKPAAIASKIMFDAAKISYWQYKPRHETIVIDMYEGVR